ncbi:peptidoglycan-binding domain-containing protein [Brevibacterium atlanticum]|uniref:peptidoglycan-binding domain-containing protein n=1 Tax=Brevibacterium atlanticum TaxID=2697563 RepID=UPI00141EC5B1|nr:peptidoglycan-binding protein [Brevibacterium atlanticum]
MKRVIGLLTLTLALTGAGVAVPVATSPQPAEAASCSSQPTISRGSTGQAVFGLQTSLMQGGLPYRNSPWNVTADGVFGSKTEKAVRDFQKKHGLSVDGIVGKKTWCALYAV